MYLNDALPISVGESGKEIRAHRADASAGWFHRRSGVRRLAGGVSAVAAGGPLGGSGPADRMGKGGRSGDRLRIMRRLAICLILTAAALLAQPPNAELLWPKGAPGALGTAQEDQPSLAPFVLAKGSGAGTAVIVCPGRSEERRVGK